MKLYDLLSNMEKHALDQEFIKAINDFYKAGENPCDSTEEDYKIAMEYFDRTFSDAQKETLKDIADTYEKSRNYAAAFGYKCGLFGAFRQYFTGNSEVDGGFQSLLVNDLFMEPKMQRHSENYSRISHCHALVEDLGSCVSEQGKEHLVSIECAWSNRVYNAALHGFYCGYHAAYDLIGCLEPLSKIQNMGRILTMEHSLGLIQPYADMEPIPVIRPIDIATGNCF